MCPGDNLCAVDYGKLYEVINQISANYIFIILPEITRKPESFLKLSCNQEVSWCLLKGNIDQPFHKNEVYIKDFFSKCNQIRRKLRIWSHPLKNS